MSKPTLTQNQFRLLRRLSEGFEMEQAGRAPGYTLVWPDGNRRTVTARDGDALYGYGLIARHNIAPALYGHQLTPAGLALLQERAREAGEE